MVMAKSDRHLERAKEFLKISEEEAERAERERIQSSYRMHVQKGG
jgi:hypothetical protein